MTSHLALMSLFAAFVSVIFATLMRDTPREQIRLGARMFAGFIGLAIVAGWVLFFLPL